MKSVMYRALSTLALLFCFFSHSTQAMDRLPRDADIEEGHAVDLSGSLQELQESFEADGGGQLSTLQHAILVTTNVIEPTKSPRKDLNFGAKGGRGAKNYVYTKRDLEHCAEMWIAFLRADEISHETAVLSLLRKYRTTGDKNMAFASLVTGLTKRFGKTVPADKKVLYGQKKIPHLSSHAEILASAMIFATMAGVDGFGDFFQQVKDEIEDHKLRTALAPTRSHRGRMAINTVLALAALFANCYLFN